MEAPVALDAQVKPKVVDQKDKKKSHKSRKGKKPKRTVNLKRNVAGLLHRSQNNLPSVNRGVVLPLRLLPVPVRSMLSSLAIKWTIIRLLRLLRKTGSTSQAPSFVYPAGHGQPSGGACAYPPEQEGLIFDTDQFSDDVDRSGSVSDSEDGRLSDSTELPEQTEDMTYRETSFCESI